MNIVVAGASGYVGRSLLPELLKRFPDAEITALSRGVQSSQNPRLQWRACDLFSLKSVEQALPDQVDVAYYLVHSMGPTAQLDQGSFADYDLILADNFARALAQTQLKHLIYLGGIIPEQGELSQHLESRKEVEEVFKEHQLPATIFRAGLVMGEEGSSFQMLLKLVKRLPVMICPQWTQTLTTPVDLATVLEALGAVAGQTEHRNKTYDLAGCRPLSYVQMMRETAKHLGKRSLFVTVPFFTPTLSRLWVSLITNSPRGLVYPLIESLEHSMVARDSHLFLPERSRRSYSELLKGTSMKVQPGRRIFQFRPQRKTVRSIQRLPLPPGKNAEWIKTRYILWLPRYFSPFIKVKVDEERGQVIFAMVSVRWHLLELRFSPERSLPDRQLLYIKKGTLVAKDNKGRLEFRVVLGRRYVLAAIHDYKPSLPWFIYKFTQAQLHALVMRAFCSYLERGFKQKNY